MSSRKRTPDQEPAKEETSTAVADPPAAANDNQPNFADRVGQRKFTAAPDPFGIAGDYVAGVRLFESKQDRQMALKFDEKPSQAVIDKLKEAGYRWNPTDRIWAHPVRADSAMTTRIEAERLYQEVRQMIRQEKGIDTGQEIPF
jgi:hypothetical protein